MKKLLLCMILSLGLITLTSCNEDNGPSDFTYVMRIDGYHFSYTGSISGMPSPLTYLNSLKLKSNFTINADNQEQADAQAISTFNSEMSKIDETQLHLSGNDYVKYTLTSANGVIKEKTFGTNAQ